MMRVVAHDIAGNIAADTSQFQFYIYPCTRCGDANDDHSIDITDPGAKC